MSEQSTPEVVVKSNTDWEAIPGFLGYRINREGCIQSCRKKGFGAGQLSDKWTTVKHCITRRGYPYVNLYLGNKKYKRVAVHRMVLLAFVGPCPSGMEACHNDGVASNCHLSNMRWDTPESNRRDRDKHGRLPKGSANFMSKLTEKDIPAIWLLHQYGYGLERIADMFCVDKTQITKIVRGETWKHVPKPVFTFHHGG